MRLLLLFWRVAPIGFLIVYCLAPWPVQAAPITLPTLTTAEQVHNLLYQRSLEKYPVHLRRAQVTYYNPELGNLFIRDSSHGVYVDMRGEPTLPLRLGTVIEVWGITGPGGYAPVIADPRVRIIRQARLPRPHVYSLDHLLSGMEDSQWIEAEGIVRWVQESTHVTAYANQAASGGGNILVSLATGVGSVDVIVREAGGFDYSQLVDSKVAVQAVCGPRFNNDRQLLGIHLFVQSFAQFHVLQPGPSNPFSLPIRDISTVMRYAPDAVPGHRIRVRGVVTADRSGHFISIANGSHGLFIYTNQESDLKPGDLIDVVGFPVMRGYSPVLEDVIYRRLGTGLLPRPAVISAKSLFAGAADAELVRLRGRLLQQTSLLDERTLLITADNRTFAAVLPAEEGREQLASLRDGSILQVTGTCFVEVAPDKTPRGVQILLRSPEDVVVVRAAPWWTVQHTLTTLGLLLLAVLGAIGWITVLRRRIRRQMGALQKAREEAAAINDMARAMQEVATERRFTARVSAAGNEHLAQLGIGFNQMLAELEKGEQAKEQAEAELQRQALTDELTGLPNRRLLADRLAQSVAMAQREGRILGLLYIDLDGFKLVNDSLGHTIGDLLLGHVAGRLRLRIRQADTLARLGGDEFTVILTSLRAPEDAEKVALNLLEALSEAFLIEGHEISIGASMGISLYPRDTVDPEILLQQADSAMYAAKRGGKNQVQYFTPEIGSSVREQMSLENQLRGAVGRGEIHLHYQPEFDLLSRRLIRFEALARWTHPVLGSIPPAKFIHVAEESGQIIALGNFIIEQACNDAVKWQAIAPSPVQVAVNVSSLQFARPRFVEDVAGILKRTGLKPELLQIELTESVMLQGTERAGEIMKRLRNLGVGLAIDDFGTGYSCLSYLPTLPFNALKIDRSFVHEMQSRTEAKAIVRSLVTLAHSLEMQVVVEGVETPEQLEAIRELGGNEVQGFLLGKPTADPESHLQAAALAAQEDMRQPSSPGAHFSKRG
jgi:diguanylate cyclase (GGDEF)-like protein